MDLQIVALSDRPELARILYDFPGAWPEFLLHDTVTQRLYANAVARNPELCLVAYDRTAPDRLIARATALPVPWDGRDESLPATGCGGMISNWAADALAGHEGQCVGGMDVVIQREARGLGLAARLLAAIRDNVARCGFRDLVIPVRPNHKHRYPDLSMVEYMRLSREDGLLVDPWLRVHQRAGGRIVGVAPASLTVVDTLARWRAWTGLPFDVPGPVYVAEALEPVWCDVRNDRAVYIESTIWVHHSLAEAGR